MATRIVRYPGTRTKAQRTYVATIGNFDGIHLGHRVILERVVASARRRREVTGGDIASALVSFYPHPLTVVAKVIDPPRLSSFRQQMETLSEIGIDLLVMVHFTQAIAALSPREFLEQLLVSRLNVEHLIVGADARIGNNRSGTPEVISAEMASMGRSAEVLSLVSDKHAKIGSRSIREYINAGDFKRAEHHLGRPFRLDGTVIRGDGRGKTIGIPTANLAVNNQVLPPSGVYAVNAVTEQGTYWGVANIGVRPTFKQNSESSVEVHLLDFGGETLYKQRLQVEFVAYIRPEAKFDSVTELVAQIRCDIEEAREIFDEHTV